MELNKEEEKALEGEYGEALAIAYRVLLALGEAMGADRLIEIKWAHVSGVNYNTIGDAGLKFLEDLSKSNSKVKVRTSLNPIGYDPNKLDDVELSEEFVEKQNRIMKAYEKLGIENTYTCIPYEALDGLPKEKTQVSIAESNAAIYVNSIMNLYTNKESAVSALASALTGKAPYSKLRIEEERKAKFCIEVKTDLKNELEYGLLGHYAGSYDENCIAFNLRKPIELIEDKSNIKALCSALGTFGSAGMFTLDYRNCKEKIEFTGRELKELKDKLSNSDKGDLIVFGSPQLGLDEIKNLINILKSRKFSKRCILFCARNVYQKAKKLGYVDKLERSNVTIFCDSCSCLTPLIKKEEFDSVITNSVKAAYYLRSWNKLGVCLEDMKTIVEKYSR